MEMQRSRWAKRRKDPTLSTTREHRGRWGDLPTSAALRKQAKPPAPGVRELLSGIRCFSDVQVPCRSPRIPNPGAYPVPDQIALKLRYRADDSE